MTFCVFLCYIHYRGDDMTNYKGAIFDLDGTLADSMGIWDEIDIEFLAKRGIRVPRDYMAEIAHLGAYETALYTIKRFNLGDTPEGLIAEWTLMADERYARVKLKPGALEFLKHLRNNGIKIAVATATEKKLVMTALQATGISDYIDTVVTLADVKRGKEFPDIYLKCSEIFGINPEECLVFEDLLLALKGAKSGGFSAVAMYDEYSKNNLSEIKKVCDKLIYDFREMM